MGNFWEKSGMKRDEVLKNIFQINQITKTMIFMVKLEIYLIFELDDSSAIKRKSRKIIKVTIYDFNKENNMTTKRKKPIIMTIEDFYKYFNLLINSRSIFLSEQMRERLRRLTQSKLEKFGEDESGICPICSENNVNMSLPCSHFFCDKCIKTWLVKSESCPLCRYKLNLNKQNPTGVAGAQMWNVIDSESIDQDELEKENMESLQLLTKSFFQKKNK